MMNIFYRLILLVLLIIGPSLVHTSAYAATITCNALVDDNSTDNTAALNACIKAAQSETEKTVSIPNGSKAYKFNYFITVPKGVSIIGAGGSTFNGKFRLSNYSKMINMTFSRAGRRIILGEIGNSSGYITGAEVRNCTFGISTWSSIIGYRVNDCIFDGNTFNNVKYIKGKKAGANLTILGGKRNKITNNITYGGKTGIIFKYSLLGNGGGYESLIEDNIVKYNTVEGFLEEGITFDLTGNDPAQIASLEYDTILSANGFQVTLSHANWSLTGNPSYVGYDMIFLSGTLAGQLRRITAQSRATFTLDKSVSGAAKGDKIVIGATFKNNIISKNRVINKGGFSKGSIILFGMAFYNKIEGNIVENGGISIRSLDNLVRSKDSVTGTWGRAPCGYNLVKDNNVGHRVILLYHAFPVMKGHANTYSSYNSYGNAVINNKISDRLWANRQYFYSSGNSGTTEFYDTTRIDENPFDPEDAKRIDIEAPRGLKVSRN
jgi:hypothetical protein